MLSTTVHKALIKLLGFRVLLLHGDTLVLDRWRWLRRRVGSGHSVLDVGCGSGAFTIGLSLAGNESLGISWSAEATGKAIERAKLLGAVNAKFMTLDIRQLDQVTTLHNAFDVVVCCEVIEHIIDDSRLMNSMALCLKPGGQMLLTTPNLNSRPMFGDTDVLSSTEDGGHVRPGYNPAMLQTLAAKANLTEASVSYCSGFVSQQVTGILRRVATMHPIVRWCATLPLRALVFVDKNATALLRWPDYSICLQATKK